MGRHETDFRRDFCDVRPFEVPYPIRIRVAPPAEPVDAGLARAFHARQQLEAALDHGTALMAALGLPPLPSITRAIAVLDALDAPGEDLEDDGTAEEEPDDEATGDDEPSLGACEQHDPVVDRSGGWAEGASDDRELGDDNGLGDLDGYHEQCGAALGLTLPWSRGGYVA